MGAEIKVCTMGLNVKKYTKKSRCTLICGFLRRLDVHLFVDGGSKLDGSVREARSIGVTACLGTYYLQPLFAVILNIRFLSLFR
jgi:hypothetical protein